MLKTVGFKRVEVVADYRPVPFRLARALYYKLKRGFRFFDTLRSDRMVFHAWREQEPV